MISIVALIVACLALGVAVISLLGTGTLAARTRATRPRPVAASLADGPQEMRLKTAGESVAELLGPFIDYSLPTDEGEASVRDMFLVDDGLLVMASSGCATCRHIIAESNDLLRTEGARVLIAAPSIERGREFMERDCGVTDVKYQVDVHAERARAMGVIDFPAAVIVRDGRMNQAFVPLVREHVEKVLAMSQSAELPEPLADHHHNAPANGRQQ